MSYEYRGLNRNGEWEYGGINDKKTMIVRGFTFLSVIPETIGKNTHCCDINGKEAFEGDIVLPVDGKTPLFLMEVVYCEKLARFRLKLDNEGGEPEWYDFEDGEFKIKGNIHENSEMVSSESYYFHAFSEDDEVFNLGGGESGETSRSYKPCTGKSS